MNGSYLSSLPTPTYLACCRLPYIHYMDFFGKRADDAYCDEDKSFPKKLVKVPMYVHGILNTSGWSGDGPDCSQRRVAKICNQYSSLLLMRHCCDYAHNRDEHHVDNTRDINNSTSKWNVHQVSAVHRSHLHRLKLTSSQYRTRTIWSHSKHPI